MLLAAVATASYRRPEIRNKERGHGSRAARHRGHHVSAIAVQAQAGGVVAARQPEKAGEVLAAIEAEASRTLVEMREMVRVLRDRVRRLRPSMGVADLPALARTDAGPTVDVAVASASLRLPGPVDAALYGIAQESLTNAARRARGSEHGHHRRTPGR